jgi:hypothetical protein
MNERGLYQSGFARRAILFALCCWLLAACSALVGAPALQVRVLADGEQHALSLPAGSDVAAALQAAGVRLGALDRSEPASLAPLEDGAEIRVVRVSEGYEVETLPLPFVSRTLQNEGMAVGEQRLIQNGANGSEEVTYRLLYEDGELVGRTVVRSQVLLAPVEEIVMIGAQSPFSALAIPGRLAFLAGGNAWLLETNSGARQALVTSGDLDGRIFDVSPDGEWLLFSRRGSAEEEINSLWVLSLNDLRQIELGVSNVVHYAGWTDSAGEIAYSSVEPSVNPPGWSANNDVQRVRFSANGSVSAPQALLPPRRTESLYSWWGSTYAWSASGVLAYAQPDAIGAVDVTRAVLQRWLAQTPYQSGSDWAWMPSLAWGADGWLYTVVHAEQSGLEQQGRSPLFDLVAFSPQGELRPLAANVGMFANPVPEPGGGQVAYLRAFTPTQSDISSYELMVLAPESGASLALFPPQGAAGLQPQRLAWAPSSEGGAMLAFVYQGNLWVANVLSGETRQLTGDGQVSALDWQ